MFSPIFCSSSLFLSPLTPFFSLSLPFLFFSLLLPHTQTILLSLMLPTKSLVPPARRPRWNVDTLLLVQPVPVARVQEVLSILTTLRTVRALPLAPHSTRRHPSNSISTIRNLSSPTDLCHTTSASLPHLELTLHSTFINR